MMSMSRVSTRDRSGLATSTNLTVCPSRISELAISCVQLANRDNIPNGNLFIRQLGLEIQRILCTRFSLVEPVALK